MSDGLPPDPELEQAAERIRQREEEERRIIEQRLMEQQEELRAEALRIEEREKRERELAEQREKERQEELRAEALRIKAREKKESEIAEMRERARKFELRMTARRLSRREALERKQAIQREAEREKALRHAVSLQVTGEGERTDTIDPPKPEIFYIIVGRGPAAVINHTTLRQSEWGKTRIGTRRVLHIGFLNPWARFMEHGMGQPPHLLSLPGFLEPPPDVTVDGGLTSKVFAALVDEEFERLEVAYFGRIVVNGGWVVHVQTVAMEKLAGPPRDALTKEGMNGTFLGHVDGKLAEKWANKDASLRVLVMAAKPLTAIDTAADLELFYADYVDICTGAGRPMVADLPGEPTVYIEARTKPWLPAEGWDSGLLNRKIMNAVDAIRDETPWTKGEHVCVTAGGGVGLNAAEKSTNEEAWLDWFGRDSLIATFNNPRNDTILRHPREDRRLEPGESKLEDIKADQLIPFAVRSRFGGGAVLDTVATGAPLAIKLKANAPLKPPKIRDYYRNESDLHGSGYWEYSIKYREEFAKDPSTTYDRLILPNGQGFDQPGQPKHLAGHLTLTPLLAADGRMLVLSAVGDRVRVMGAAAQNLGDGSITGSTASKAMITYRTSMAVSAVPDGFILSGSNIANANHFFDASPNNNLNTLTQTELQEALRVATCGNPAGLAVAIVEGRKGPDNNGFATMDQVIEKLRGGGVLGDGDEEKIRRALRTNYEPSSDTKLLPAMTLI